jgi:MFS family permease
MGVHIVGGAMAGIRRANVLRHRDFRLLFIGQSASEIGSQAVAVAIALYITKRTGSATDLAIVLGAASVPFVVLVVVGGVWADRLPRHRLIIGSDLTRAALHTLLGILILTGSPAIWLMAVIEALFGAAQALFQPAYTGLAPQTVPEDEIQAAQALVGFSFNLATVLGPVLATALVLTLGAGPMFLIDAASFLFGALLLIPVQPRERVLAQEPSQSFIHELRVGFREVSSRVWVWGTIVAYTGVVLFALVPWLSLGPLAVRQVYGNVGFYGVLVAIWGSGSIAGSLLATVWHPRHPLRLALAFGVVWAMLGLLVAFGVARPILVAGALLSGGAGALTGIWWETTLAHHIPPGALSRVSAWDWMGSLALMPLGYAVVGPLADAFGVRWVLGVGSAIGALMAALALIPKSVRALPAVPPDAMATSLASGPATAAPSSAQ